MTDVTVERKFGGMPKWAFFTPWWSRVNGKPFLSRFIVFITPWAGMHITWIRAADNQREFPHDHSRTFLSFKLLGGYEEDVYTDPADLTAVTRRAHGWLSAHVMSLHHAHSITRVRPFTVTVLLLGPRRQPSNYWTPDGKKTTGFKIDEWS
jgi:hypothetical protein